MVIGKNSLNRWRNRSLYLFKRRW